MGPKIKETPSLSLEEFKNLTQPLGKSTTHNPTGISMESLQVVGGNDLFLKNWWSAEVEVIMASQNPTTKGQK